MYEIDRAATLLKQVSLCPIEFPAFPSKTDFNFPFNEFSVKNKQIMDDDDDNILPSLLH